MSQLDASALTEFMAQHLPIANYLQMQVHQYDGNSLALQAPLAPSINDKLTAFGGSLYCLCVMACWGHVYLQMQQRGIDANLVVSHGEIDYVKPVAGEIVAQTDQIDDVVLDDFFKRFEQHGKAKISMASSVRLGSDTLVRFHGEYAVLAYR